MRILDRLPVPQQETLAFVGADHIRIKKYEIAVWVSVATEGDRRWNPAIPRIPAILDTGHTHNFSIQQQHLLRWAGLPQSAFRELGHIRHEGRRTPLVAARLWLFRNQREQAAVVTDAPLPMEIVRGIAVHTDDSRYPRVPLLGLRAIVSNGLLLTIDGERRSVTLRSPDWRTRLLRWLA